MRTLVNPLLLILCLCVSTPTLAMEWLKETPSLAPQVEAGELPAIGDRIPDDVQVAQLRPDQVPRRP